MKKNHIILIALISALLVMSPAWAPQDGKRDIQAVLVRIINNVETKAPTKAYTKAINHQQLKAGYEVRTATKSVAVIKFIDNSKLVVRERSIAEIKGEVEGKQILDRQVHMTKGNIKFEVTKGPKEQFRFTSPISVASIRGTSGLWGQSDSTSSYVMLSGLLNLLNLISNRSEDIGEGQTGITDAEGNIVVRQSTEGEQNEAQHDDEQEQRTRRQIRITGEERDGNVRTVILEWDE
ncbi:MAG: FecR domain-containing protein [Ignavibacteriales bacterium]|nr:FecR domain-containing protein [Ignavibacteriales bacterium]